MKVLSILQPWASLCVHTDNNGKALKQIETRSWNTKYRGELLIHASKKVPTDPWLYDSIHSLATELGLIRNWNHLPYGAIIGKVNLVTTGILCPPYSDHVGPFGIYFNDKGASFTEQEMAFGNYEAGRYGWLFSDPVLFEKPIPAKGQLGLWNFDFENYF